MLKVIIFFLFPVSQIMDVLMISNVCGNDCVKILKKNWIELIFLRNLLDEPVNLLSEATAINLLSRTIIA